MRSRIMNLKEINPLVLAYLGDSVYETYIRLFLVKKNIPNIGSLQKESLSYVTAKSQASILTKLIDANFFDEEELTIIRRARNTKGHMPPKGCDLATYHFATAFEAVIGYLYLKGDNKKIMNLMEKIEMLLNDCLIDISEVDGFVVSKGPGSFTGLRIGMATFKGLSMGANKP